MNELPARASELMRMLEPDLYYADDFRDTMRRGYTNELGQPSEHLFPSTEVIERLNADITEMDATVSGYLCGIMKARHERSERN